MQVHAQHYCPALLRQLMAGSLMHASGLIRLCLHVRAGRCAMLRA